MADTAWQVIPTIVAGKPVPDQWSKGVYNNADLLSNPSRQIEQGQTITNYDFTLTSSLTYVVVDANYWSKTFYSSGRDILLTLNSAVWITAADQAGALDFEIDGVSPFGANGFMLVYYQGTGTYNYQPFGFCYPLFDLAAGSHTFVLKQKRVNAGSGQIGVATVTGYNTFAITEF